MKRLQLILLFLFSLGLCAQTVDLTFQVDELKQKIWTTEHRERLIWMDSLSRLMRDSRGLPYDSIARQTIDYALELDSTRLAIIHTESLMAYIRKNLGKPEQAVQLFKDIKDSIPRNDFFSEMSSLYFEGAHCYSMLEHLEEAVNHYEQAYTFAFHAKDSTEMGILKDRIGMELCLMGDFQRAAATLEESVQILSRSDPELVWEPKATMSILYSQNGLQEEAKKIRMEIVAEAKKYENYNAIHYQFYNQAFDEMLHGDQKERIKYFDSARVYAPKLDNPIFLQETLVSQLSAYAENNMMEKAEMVKKELEEQRKKIAITPLDEYNLAMAQYEFAKNNYKKAAIWGEKEYDLLKNTQAYEGIYMVHDFLSKVYDSLGDLERSYTHFKAYHKIKDSIESVQKANGFSYYQALYETEKKDSEIETQKSEIALLNAKNRSKNLWMIFGGFGVVALFTIVYLWRVQHFSRKKQQMHMLFSRHLIKGQETERIRLARELHDGVGQKLVLLTKTVKQMGNCKVDSVAQNTLEELRSLSRQLYPAVLERLGLSGAIRSLVDEIDANTDIFFTHEIDNIDKTVTKETSLHLFRMIQEIINNTVKHSRAKTCFVNVEQEAKAIAVKIKDDGIGFVFRERLRESSSLGLRMLLERAKIIESKFQVDSEYMKGTTISLVIPT